MYKLMMMTVRFKALIRVGEVIRESVLIAP